MANLQPRLAPRQLRYSYPVYTKYGTAYALEYNSIKRAWVLTINGKLKGAYRHPDYALRAILENITGWKQDDIPPKFRPLLNSIAQKIGLTYEGLPQ